MNVKEEILAQSDFILTQKNNVSLAHHIVRIVQVKICVMSVLMDLSLKLLVYMGKKHLIVRKNVVMEKDLNLIVMMEIKSLVMVVVRIVQLKKDMNVKEVQVSKQVNVFPSSLQDPLLH